MFILRQYVLFPGEYIDPITPAPSASLSPSPSPTPSFRPKPSTSPIPSPSPEPTEYIKPIPVRIYFTDRKIMCDVLPVGIIEDGERAGQMDTIDDPDVSAWYELGPAPGEEGNAILNGHKSWKGKIGIFSVLWDMETGENVAISFENGDVRRFRVISKDFYDFDKVPASVMKLDSEFPKMTLITCYGEFSSTFGTSVQRCVVVCVPEEDYVE